MDRKADSLNPAIPSEGRKDQGREEGLQQPSALDTYERMMQHYLKLGRIAAWKQHVWVRVQELEKEPSGLFKGFQKDFLDRIGK